VIEENSVPRRSLREGTSPRQGDHRELALLSAAEELLREGAFEEASIPELAARAGISRPTFYFYFASKQALLNSLVARTLDELTESLSTRLAAAYAEPRAAVQAALRAVADLWFDHRAVMMAAAEVAAKETAIFERLAGTNEALREPSAQWLLSGRHVTTLKQARELAEILMWMSERNFYVLARQSPSRRRLRALADRLCDVWVRAAGLA